MIFRTQVLDLHLFSVNEIQSSKIYIYRAHTFLFKKNKNVLSIMKEKVVEDKFKS